MATVKLMPSGTHSSNWDLNNTGGGSSAHANLAEVNDSNWITANDQNKFCVLEVDNYTSGGTVDSIRWYVKGAYRVTRGGDTDIQVVLGTGSHDPAGSGADAYFSETFTLTFNAGYAVQEYYGTARTTDGSSAWDSTSLNALRLDINTTPEAPNLVGGPDEEAFITRAYVEVTYDTTVVTVADNATFFGANF